MKYHHDEQSVPDVTSGAQRMAELHDIAGELRKMWHLMTHGATPSRRLEGLERQQVWVLGALSTGPRRMTDLAGCAHTSQASLTGIVDRLEEHGLVHRTRSGEDRRVVQVELTEQGRTEMRLKQERIAERLDEVLAPLSDADRAEFLRLLRIVTRHDAECGAGGVG